MIKTIFAIIFVSSLAQAWDCPKTYDSFKNEILKLNEKAIKLTEADGSKDLLYQTGESGELVTLLAVSRLDKNETMAGFAMQCWTHYYEFLESLRKSETTRDEKRLRNEFLGNWEECFMQFYPNKSIAKEIVACHRSLTK